MSGPVGAVTPNNDAYGGGGLFRNAPPTSGPTGSLPGPNTSSLAAGVNPQSAPFYARPNEGTNIRIPYGRVTPLADPRATGLPDVSGSKASTPTSLMSPTDYRASLHGDVLIKPYMSETDTLRPSRLAFILAKKSVHGPGAMLGRDSVAMGEDGLSREDGKDTATANARDFSYAINSTIAPSLPGTQRLQKLCSFEYAQRYVDVACNLGQVPLVLEVSNVVLNNDDDYKNNDRINLLHAKNVAKWYNESASYGGRLNSIVASALARGQTFADNQMEAQSMARHLSDNGIAYTITPNNVEDTIVKLREEDAKFVDKFKSGDNMDILETALSKSTDRDPLVMSGLPSNLATLGSMDNMGMVASEVDSQANPLFASPMARGPSKNLPMRPIRYSKFLPTSDGNNANFTGNEVFAKKKRQYGIFTCDEGPFLRGHAAIGSNELTAHGLLTSQRDPRNVLRGVPSRVCTAEGDIVAFSILESQLSVKGLFDWTPDGLCLSKFSNVPDDVLEDQRIDARDGVLYNVAIQGPAIATNWTGSPHLAVLPSDRVFIVIIADAISVEDALMSAVLDAHRNSTVLDTSSLPNDRTRNLALMLAYMFKLKTNAPAEAAISTRQQFAQAREAYMREDALTKTPSSYVNWQTNAAGVADGTVKNNVLLHNYRLEVATSSQMANYSGLRFENGGNQNQHEFSRMGLKLGSSISEYIVGGWCIGSVMDSAASRAAMPNGMSIGPRTAPNTAAINLYVDIEYWSGDKLYRKYANVAGKDRGLIRARFEPPETDKITLQSVDEPTATYNLPSTVDLAAPAGSNPSDGIAETSGNRPTPVGESQPILEAALQATTNAAAAETLASTYATAATADKPGIAARVGELAKKVADEAKKVTDEYEKVNTDTSATMPKWLDDANKAAEEAVAKAQQAVADAA